MFYIKHYRGPRHMKLWIATAPFFFPNFFPPYRARSKASLGKFVEQRKDWKTEDQRKNKIKRKGGDF